MRHITNIITKFTSPSQIFENPPDDNNVQVACFSLVINLYYLESCRVYFEKSNIIEKLFQFLLKKDVNSFSVCRALQLLSKIFNQNLQSNQIVISSGLKAIISLLSSSDHLVVYNSLVLLNILSHFGPYLDIIRCNISKKSLSQFSDFGEVIKNLCTELTNSIGY